MVINGDIIMVINGDKLCVLMDNCVAARNGDCKGALCASLS